MRIHPIDKKFTNFKFIKMKTQLKYSLSLRFNHFYFLSFMGKTFSADFFVTTLHRLVNIYLATVNKYICNVKDTDCLNTY